MTRKVSDTRHEFADALKANKRRVWFRGLRSWNGKTVRMQLVQCLTRRFGILWFVML